MNLTLKRRLGIAALLLVNGLDGPAVAANMDASTSASASSEPTIAAKAVPAPTKFREIKWEELIPKGWDPSKRFRGRNTTILVTWTLGRES